ncbi:MAG: class I SAM-dependent methyltransferase [Candidatus Omnitrophota bacterium]|nr:class I SAM-dependent methyltransferase [Candidatus Omnitrophota bacterium]MDZ4242874.1 class I SAM-dependent methyltransferase [Candidatus Omnitrophota bacterium]
MKKTTAKKKLSRKVIERFSKPMDMRKLNRSTDWRVSAATRRAQDARRFSAETVEVPCPVCKSLPHRPLAEVYGFRYVTCDTCTHVYVKNVPVPERLKAFYEGALEGVAMRPSEDLVQKDLYLTRVKDISIPKVEYVTKCLGKKGRWVDIGCGSGELLYAARKRGWETTGYEIDPDEIYVAKDVFKLDVRRGYLDRANAAKMLEGASVVSFFSVLEHVADPVALVRLAGEFAPKNAALVLELPHHPSVSALTNMAFPNLVARHMLPPNHLSLFTDASVRHMLRQAGFSPSHVWYYGQDFYELIGTVSALAGFRDEEALNKLLDAAGEFQKTIDARKLSDEVIVIARR